MMINELQNRRQREIAQFENIDLGLSVIETIREQGQALDTRTIAQICGCKSKQINYLYNSALKKLRASRKLDTLANLWVENYDI